MPPSVRDILLACAVLFGALLVWPLLTIPNRPGLMAGVPPLVLYLYGLWGAIVLVLGWVAWRARSDDGP